MFDPLFQHVTLRLSDRATDQSSFATPVTNGGTVFFGAPGKYKADGLIFPGQVTSFLQPSNAAGTNPAGDVESTVEMFVRPSALGGANQVIASWGAGISGGNLQLRLVIRDGYYNIETATIASSAWRTIPSPAVAAVFGEWQFLVLIQEIEPSRVFKLYAGVSGVCSYIGAVDVADYPVATGIQATSIPALSIGRALTSTNFTSQQLAPVYTEVQNGISAPNQLIWQTNIHLAFDATTGVGRNVSVVFNGAAMGGVIGVGQTPGLFLRDVVRPNILAHIASTMPSVVGSVSIPPDMAASSAAITVTWGNINTTDDPISIVMAPIGQTLARFQGNMSELRITTVRRRYFDPFSTPPNQVPTVPETSWDGGSEGVLTRSFPAALLVAAGSPGGAVAGVLPKMTVVASGTLGGGEVVDPANSGTVLVKRSSNLVTITDGLTYTAELSEVEGLGATAVAVASTSRSTGKWYFEVAPVQAPDPQNPGFFLPTPEITVGVMGSVAAASASTDIGEGASAGFVTLESGPGIYMGGEQQFTGGPYLTFQYPPQTPYGVVFDADARTLRFWVKGAGDSVEVDGQWVSTNGWMKDTYGSVVPELDVSPYLAQGDDFFPAMRVDRSIYVSSVPGDVRVNFGASVFEFPEALIASGAEPFDTRQPYAGELAGLDATLPSPGMTCAARGGGRADATLPGMRVAATGSETTLNQAELQAPTMAITAGGGASATLTAPQLVMSASGTVVGVGRVDAALPALGLTATGRVSGQAAAFLQPRGSWEISAYSGGSARVVAPSALMSAQGLAGAVGRATIVLPMFDASAQGYRENSGGVVGELPAMQMLTPGRGGVQLPAFTLVAAGLAEVTLTALETYALTLPHSDKSAKGVPIEGTQATRFVDFPFTQIVRFNGEYYGMASDGLYLIGGDTDAGVPIQWEFDLCVTDFGSTQKKNVVSAYIGGVLGPQTTVTVRSGETSATEHVSGALLDESTKNHREVFGRGRRERYYSFGVSGTGPMSVDSIEFEINNVTRRT